MNIKLVAAEIVGLIVNDIRTNESGRGIKECWEALDPEVRGFMRADWALTIEACLKEHIDDPEIKIPVPA